MSEMKFYRCQYCGQIVAIVNDTGMPIICCGEVMEGMVPGTTDASLEKHVPVFKGGICRTGDFWRGA